MGSSKHTVTAWVDVWWEFNSIALSFLNGEAMNHDRKCSRRDRMWVQSDHRHLTVINCNVNIFFLATASPRPQMDISGFTAIVIDLFLFVSPFFAISQFTRDSIKKMNQVKWSVSQISCQFPFESYGNASDRKFKFDSIYWNPIWDDFKTNRTTFRCKPKESENICTQSRPNRRPEGGSFNPLMFALYSTRFISAWLAFISISTQRAFNAPAMDTFGSDAPHAHVRRAAHRHKQLIN